MNFAKVTKSNDVKGARVGKIFPMLSKKSGWVKFTLDSGEEAKLRSGSLEVIEADIRALEDDITRMLGEVTS